jgi:dihydroorotase
MDKLKMSNLLIKSGRIIDPMQGIDKTADLLIKEGAIDSIEENIDTQEGTDLINAQGKIVSPGFIDLHCHLREPGYEHKETIATGTAAAAKGGFTTICAMPNTNPVADNQAVIDFVLKKARDEGTIRVLPIGAITKGSMGKELTEMSELAHAGVIGFSDDGNPLEDDNIMRQALSYSSLLTLPIINHCEVPRLSIGGSINEGWISNRLGLKGNPSSSETIMAARDIELAQLTGGQIHIAHASTSGTIELVRQAKKKGINVTCEVTPHHLTLNQSVVLGNAGMNSGYTALGPDSYDQNAKVAPPLRTEEDIDALKEGLRDGSVDFIATDHAPHSQVEKFCSFQEAAFGISVFETALGSLMSLVHSGDIPMAVLIEKMTSSPAGFLNTNLGNLKPGTTADITIIDTEAEWEVDSSAFVSKGLNTPLNNTVLKGQVIKTIFGGEIIYDAMDNAHA